MRMLFTSVPAPSHIDPMLPLALAAAEEHDVTIATGPALIPMVEKAGLRAIPVGLDWSEPDAERTFPELRTMPLEEKTAWWVREIFFDRAGRPMARDVSALLEREPADVLIRTHIEFGGLAAAAAHDVAQVVLGLGEMFPVEVLPRFRELIVGALQEVDALDRWQDMHVYGDLFLQVHPASYTDWLPPVPWVRCRPPVPAPEAVTPPRPEVLDDASDAPVVLVTFGTVFNRTPGAFELVLEALSALDVFAVATVGPNRDPAELGPEPDNVRIRRFVPYRELLPHCDAVITHGGYGTTMGSLIHGIPLVIIPLGADQAWHGERCTALGVGETVEFKSAGPATVADAVERVLDDGSYRVAARTFQQEMLAMPPLSSAVPRIAEAAARRQPTR